MAEIIEIENKKHSKLSCSGSSRFLICAGSIQLEAQANPTGKRTSTRFAAEGTVAHEVCDLCLANDEDPIGYLGKKMTADGFTFTVNAEMIDAVVMYINYIHTLESAYTRTQSEVWGDLKPLGIEGLDGGTTDCLIVDPEHRIIHVIDFKYGQGVAVEVEKNSQLMCYGLAPLLQWVDSRKLDNWLVKLVIVQPRAYHPDGVIRDWSISANALLKWGTDILKVGAALTHTKNPPIVVDQKACQFCGAAGICPELHKKAQDMAIVDFDTVDVLPADKFPKLAELTTSQKSNIVTHAKAIKAFMDAVEKQIHLEISEGSTEYENVFKLVRKQTRRKFTEEAIDPDFSPLIDVLDHSEIFAFKMETLGNIERALKAELGNAAAKEFLIDLVVKPEGDLTLALITDKRIAVSNSTQSDFKDI